MNTHKLTKKIEKIKDLKIYRKKLFQNINKKLFRMNKII